MPYFVIYALDKPGMSDVRNAHRPAHRARLRDPGDIPIWVAIGGPMTNDAGEMIGTMLVVEAPAKETVETFVQGDPYALAGLYDRVDIRPYRWGLGEPKELRYG